MPDDVMQELRKIQRYAAGMGSLLARAQENAPARAAGTDSTGAVEVALGREGLPERIRVRADWRHRIDPAAFGAAVGEAFVAANAARMETWMATLREQGWEADLDRLRAEPGGPGAQVPPRRRARGVPAGAPGRDAAHAGPRHRGPPRRLQGS